MIGKILGAVIGGEIDRAHGESGAKGAALGVAGVEVAKLVVPLALLAAGVLVARKLVDSARGE